ncbi:MAG: hypothetical protein MMC33_000737 [Icmadophila ericetorum]|nr:hypothetical protein [Icmadophila ericetorum]
MSTVHPANRLTKDPMSTRKQIAVPPDARKRDALDTTTVKGNSVVKVNEKKFGKSIESDSTKPPRRQYRNLKHRPRFSQLLVWTVMIVSPSLFIVLAILTVRLNRTPADSYKGFAITEAIKGGVTAWPIIFAAIAAQSLKQLASYKVERGVRMITLEQLTGSHSVGAAIKQPLFLRRFDWISIALLCLWSFSPLASQAMQRMSYLDYVYKNDTTTVAYVDTTIYNGFFENTSQSETEQALFIVSLLAPNATQASPMDTWNSTKIPLLNTISDGWSPVQANITSEFSSLLGIVFERPDNFTSDNLYQADDSILEVVMQSSYLTTSNCTPQITMSKQDINRTISQSGAFLSESPSGTLPMSLAVFGTPSQTPDGQFTQLPAILTYSSVIDTASFSGTDGVVPQYSYMACNMTQTFVDSQVSCYGDQCRVVKMRPSRNVTALSNFTPSSHPAFIDSFVNVTSPTTQGSYSFIEQYITDPNFLLETGDESNIPGRTNVNITEVPLPDFQQRLSLLINTYWQAGFAPNFQTAGLSSTEFSTISFKFADAIYFESYYAYITSAGWVAVLFISSIILLAAGIASVFLDVHTIGPDVLGFANSMLRKSKYMDLPEVDGTLSGADRARALADVKVMMQDVKPDSRVGKIALGTVSLGTRRLTTGRLYR